MIRIAVTTHLLSSPCPKLNRKRKPFWTYPGWTCTNLCLLRLARNDFGFFDILWLMMWCNVSTSWALWMNLTVLFACNRMHRMKHSVEARWELVCIHLTVLRKVHTQVGLNISLQTIVIARWVKPLPAVPVFHNYPVWVPALPPLIQLSAKTPGKALKMAQMLGYP